MANVTCAVCQTNFANDAGLHRHLKKHRLNQTQYYQTYSPRYDKFTGKFILYKNKDFYFQNDFNERENLIAWLNQQSPEDAKAYLKDYFLRRKAYKNLRYAPTQVELRSTTMPGMNYLQNLFGDYYAFAKDLGFELKYIRTDWNVKLKKFRSSHHIITDTREQQPLSFSIKQKIDGLPFGDYKLNDDEFSGKTVIERKSIADFYSTLSSAYSRFGREIEKAKAAKSNFVVVIEGPMDGVYAHFQTLRANNVYVSPEYVLHNMRDACQRYPFIQFLFVKDRQTSSAVIETLLRTGGKYNDFDLQYMYDTGKLI